MMREERKRKERGRGRERKGKRGGERRKKNMFFMIFLLIKNIISILFLKNPNF